MIMKNTLILLSLTLLSLNCALGQLSPHPWKLTVKVIDEDGNPVSGADVAVSYKTTPPPNQNNEAGPKMGYIKGLTDANGEFGASHTDSSFDLGITVKKNGYYATHLGHQLYFPGQFDEKTVAANWNPALTLILKEVGHPTPMYAKSITYIKFPALNQPIGYDLMIGDWVAPYGKGANSDVYFKKDYYEKSANDYSSKITVSFADKDDGIQLVAGSNEELGSDLRSPHEAPKDGYYPELIRETSAHPGQLTKLEFDENRIYLIRIRTILDENGKVKSALYGKIYGDFMQFKYYLNPTPNDRNIEFDPKHDLVGGLQSLEEVDAP